MADPWPLPGSWLYSWVDTDVAGYRAIDIGGTPVTVTAGYYRWPDYITQLDADLTSTASWAAAVDTFGRLTLSGASAVVTWGDRAGWLCGFAAEPTQATPAAVTSITSMLPPPGGLPLISAMWEEVSIEAQRQITVDQGARAWGYAFGSARVWRWRLEMHHTSLEALRQGWMRSGKVTLASYAPGSFGGSSAWDSSTLDGHLDAYVIGMESAQPVSAAVRDFWAVTLIVTEAGP
jgi:hypothetical protein